MNDKELADVIVATGLFTVGSEWGDIKMYNVEPEHDLLCDELFVRDWRVAGALMEKVESESKTSDTAWMFGQALAWHRDGEESLPRAIIEACVEALK